MKREVLHYSTASFSSSTNSLTSHLHRKGVDNFGFGSIDTINTVGLVTSPCPSPSNSNNGCRSYCREFFRKTFQKKNLQRTFPILKWAPQYTSRKLISDLIAGITLGLTLLPQGLAYASVAGLPPIYGLYSGFVGPFVYIIFGSTKVITIGPNAVQCVLTYKFTHGKSPEYAIFLCFVCAVINLLMAIFRLGFVANFISKPVISGFTSAIALTIVSTQVNGLLGLHLADAGFLSTFKGMFEHIAEIRKWDVILGFICIACLVFLEYLQTIFRCWSKKSPKLDRFFWIISTSRNAIIIAGCTAVVAMMNSTTQPFSVVGELPAGLPEFKLPPMSIFNAKTNSTQYFGDIVNELSSAIFIMPLLGLMSHITIAKAFAGSTRVDANQESFSIGLTNAISCFFSSMPVAGSFSRTTINAFSGAQTPAGGLVTGLMVIFALQYLTPYFYFIPKTSLAAVVCASVIHMIDFKLVRPMWRSKKADLLPWGLTFLSTLFIGLEYGILTGLCISVIFLLYYAARPRVKVMKAMTSQDTEFLIFQLDRSISYPSVDHITDKIIKSVMRWGNKFTPIIIDCHHIQFVDFTAAEALKNMIISFENSGHKIIFWKVKPSVLRIVHGVMENDQSVRFTHCRSDQEMEHLVDSAARNNVAEPVVMRTPMEIIAY